LAALAIIVLQALVTTAARPAALLWIEDNNIGQAGGMPGDLIEKFRQPETFRHASRKIRVYLMRANVLNKLDGIIAPRGLGCQDRS